MHHARVWAPRDLVSPLGVSGRCASSAAIAVRFSVRKKKKTEERENDQSGRIAAEFWRNSGRSAAETGPAKSFAAAAFLLLLYVPTPLAPSKAILWHALGSRPPEGYRACKERKGSAWNGQRARQMVVGRRSRPVFLAF